MKKSIGWAASAAVLAAWWCFLVSSAAAQAPVGTVSGQPAQPATPTRVALLDVGKVIENHVRFKGMMGDLKTDMQRAEADLRKQREEIGKLEEKLQEFRKGTPDYTALEEEVTRRKAELSFKFQVQGKKFQQSQAHIFCNVYQEISQATDYFCRQNGIDLVLRIDGSPVDADVPANVNAYISKQVVWSDRGLDITDAILRELNRSAVNPPREASRPGVPFNNNQLPPR